MIYKDEMVHQRHYLRLKFPFLKGGTPDMVCVAVLDIELKYMLLSVMCIIMYVSHSMYYNDSAHNGTMIGK